ncbi:hypothetical protein HRG_013114 [Hirsutella rhossiliensis]
MVVLVAGLIFAVACRSDNLLHDMVRCMTQWARDIIIKRSFISSFLVHEFGWQIQHCTHSELSTQITLFHSANSEEALACSTVTRLTILQPRLKMKIVPSSPRIRVSSTSFLSAAFILTITHAADASALR